MRIAACLIALAAGPAAAQDPALSQMLRDADPCRALRVDLGFGEVALDQTVLAEVDRIDTDLDGSRITADGTGRIACASSAGGLLSGDVSARVEARITGDLVSCTFDPAQVRLSEFGGSLASAAGWFGGIAEEALSDLAAEAATRACRERRG